MPRRAKPPLGTRLMVSALWVIGIPTFITFLILLAAWLTERIWLLTELIVDVLAGSIL